MLKKNIKILTLPKKNYPLNLKTQFFKKNKKINNLKNYYKFQFHFKLNILLHINYNIKSLQKTINPKEEKILEN